jgi:hypothetical protein
MDFVHLYLFITTGGVAIYTSRTFFQISNERSKSIFPRRAFELSEHVQRLMNKHMTACLVNVCAIRLETNNFYNEIPTIPQFQKNWDNINIKGIIVNDLIFNSPRDLARFKALQCRESGSWLHAIPSPNIGTFLDNTSFQVCIGLRLGCNLCTPHICKCNAKVDEIGTHGLSCFKSSGRFSRHTEINSIINRSLTSIHVKSTLEPNGLSRDDGKRPDGMTLVPWIKGQPLVWDVTVVDTLADSYVLKSSEVSGSAAEMASKRKHSKYSSIIWSNYVFKGLAFETLGPWCKEVIDFINVIGNRLIAESGDSKSKKFLFERISLAIQRGKAASIRGTFPDSAILSEIFVL